MIYAIAVTVSDCQSTCPPSVRPCLRGVLRLPFSPLLISFFGLRERFLHIILENELVNTYSPACTENVNEYNAQDYVNL